MAEFVRAQIFGTTFEITSRYSDLQPVGMGAFGLVWYVRPTVPNTKQNLAPPWLTRRAPQQLCPRSAHKPKCRR
ncbi:CMGC MAPK P38 kinase [Fusarium albosuccineum]|uniref:CMGC MAPK P38 kinase n=1 Tax=Fusarium albosuccineum TaxID=1237068 RepID=A0A8H4JVW1_9HYPO|nr:CMGC MAPK P38 kinase [Fusarium albosuccineum]